MNYRSLLSNAGVAVLAQGIALCLSIFISLLVPKVLGVEEFGYWQLFILYAMYTPLATFGVNDGLYMINGGCHREDLNKQSIACQFVLAASVEMVIATAMVITALLGRFDENRTFVLIAVAAYLPLYCCTEFFGCLFQAVNETKVYSISTVVSNLLFLVPLAFLVTFRVDSFQYYVAFYCLGKVCALIFCLWKGRYLFSAGLSPVREGLRDSLSSAAVGIKLLLANIASFLIIGVTRFVIDGAWGIETFGKVSFSLTLTNFVLVFINQASMVLFPELRRAKSTELARVFEMGRDVLDIILPLAYLVYFPMCWLISMWLPQYAPSLAIFALFIPVCIFDGKMSLVGGTFLKVLRRESALLRVNLIAFAGSLVGALIGGFVLHSITVVVLSSVVAIMFRSIVAEWMVRAEIGSSGSRGTVIEVSFAVVFVVLSTFTPWGLAIPAILVLYISVVVFHRRRVFELVGRMHRRLIRR